jgi:hypothetical protein
MIVSQNRKIAFAVLVLFLTSLGAWSFNAKRLSHDMGHGASVIQLTAVDHAGDHHHGDASDDHDGLSDAEHSLLHAAGQVQPFPLSAFAWVPPTHGGAVRSLFVPPPLAHSTREPPFRPPRTDLS